MQRVEVRREKRGGFFSSSEIDSLKLETAQKAMKPYRHAASGLMKGLTFLAGYGIKDHGLLPMLALAGVCIALDQLALPKLFDAVEKDLATKVEPDPSIGSPSV